MADRPIRMADFIDKEIPKEVLDQLKVFGRIQHVLKPTVTSAISRAEDTPEIPTDKNLETERIRFLDLCSPYRSARLGPTGRDR